MPSQTVQFSDEQYQYILATKGVEQSVSERVREIMDDGMREVDE